MYFDNPPMDLCLLLFYNYMGLYYKWRSPLNFLVVNSIH